MNLRDEIKPGVWVDKVIGSLTGGMRTDIEPELLQDSQGPFVKNLFLTKGILSIDTGYQTYLSSMRGIPRLTYQMFYTSGASEELLVTNDTLYKSNNSQWQYVSDGNDTTVSTQANAGATAISVASSAGFSASDYVGIILDDGSEHQTTVASTGAGVINIDDAIPTGRNAPVSAAVVKALDLNGSLDNQVSIVVVASHDWFVFTNGVDAPKRYDGTDCVDVPNLPASGNFVAAAVTLFNGYLIFLNTIEGGTSYPQRVRRSDAGDPTNWSTGDSGYTDLVDSEDFLVAGLVLGPYLIIYRERGIIRVEFLGTDEATFNFESTVAGIGVLSHDSAIDLGDYHIILGNAGIYEYRGGYDITPISDNIYPELFGVNATADPAKSHRNWGFYVEELDEVWFAITQQGDEAPTRIFRYNAATKTFIIRDFTEPMVGFGYSSSTNNLSWNDLIGDWNEQTYKWNARQLSSASPITHLLGLTSQQIYAYDYVSPTDDGSYIPYEIQTKDFIEPGYQLRLDSIDLKYIGASVSLYYSTDSGSTWTLLEQLADVSEFTRTSVYKQFVAERIRFKLAGYGLGFGISWLKFKYRVEREV